jgi:hypothetical protein
MASALFRSYERNMKRQFWMNLIDYQVDEVRRKNFRASIVSNPFTGLPLPIEPAPPSLPAAIISQVSALPATAN